MGKNNQIVHEPYFLGVLPRVNAENCLLKKGDFAVRFDVRKKSFVSMIKGLSSVHHERLSEEGGRWHSVRKPKRKFNTINEFVEHHKKNAFLFDGEEVTIMNVNTRPFWMLTKSEMHLEKTKLEDEAEEQNAEMVTEATVMKDFKHSHVISFYGICCDESPIMIAMEFCPGGSLSSHLKKQLDAITVGERVRYCFETALGMEFLHTKELIHRDLAARNVLISSEGMLKISDFGMSKIVNVLAGERVRNLKKPLRWTAPEAVSDEAPCYTWASDVWAWGVMLYEIFGNGAQPFAEIDNDKVRAMILSCKMLPMPDKTPEEIRLLTKNGIFLKDTQVRMSFTKIVLMLRVWELKYKPPEFGLATVFQIPGVQAVAPKDLEDKMDQIGCLIGDKGVSLSTARGGSKSPVFHSAKSNPLEAQKAHGSGRKVPSKKHSAESPKSSKKKHKKKSKSPTKKPKPKASKAKKKSHSSTESDDEAKSKLR
ncbi:unnamed protein product [Bursaphelenchus okinawaensis]|uniref:Tyrosine-protein kinase n=1 Tax=Bursaphelenchus okinawaensis TaxID=465554 RepID=A0A811JV78_9BILA|nr:unnamed protein product [Bursaphelenchus okinawaensis]CAG9084601.1 unnamed protein product [Bursaphelenchus okinawaensis]